jgi:transcriptional regulator with XRE-family HTH domain
MIADLPAAQRAAVDRRAEELISEELTLRELRKALRLTQQDVARRLCKGQEVVSRLEQRDDLLLSTLRDYVRSLGGELELTCRFNRRTAVRINPGAASKPKGKAKRHRQRSAALSS